ncbi:hypothetical protein AU476_21430 [Cupriavidus sp. UYMSc13B]|nr:hypothetical protein AU476_21430 [Cupriavidus sp. UYMSc13B]
MHGKTWAVKGNTPVIERPGQRQSISAASAVNAKGAFWFATYKGALTAELFIELLKKMMKGRNRPVHLIVDGLPAHKKVNVREYIESTKGKLTMHVLPGYAPDLNPDELVWSHLKRTGVARNPLRAGEKLEIRVEQQLRGLQKKRSLIRSFFEALCRLYFGLLSNGHGLLRSLLENGVNRAQAGRYAERVVHELKGSAKRNVTHHRENDDLIEPLAGDRQHEKYLICVGCPRGIKGFIERCTGHADLSVDRRAAHAVTLSQHTDWFGAREGLKCDRFAFVGAQSAHASSGVLSHGCRR